MKLPNVKLKLPNDVVERVLQRLRIIDDVRHVPCMGKNMYKGHGDFYAIETFLLFLGDGFELDKNPVLNKSGLRMEPDGREIRLKVKPDGDEDGLKTKPDETNPGCRIVDKAWLRMIRTETKLSRR